MTSLSVFFPLRAGSVRAAGKNTRAFRPDGRSLFQHKMEQLARFSPHVAEIVVSTNDDVVLGQFEEFGYISNARAVRRPDELCASTTRLQDLIDYVPSVVTGDHILWMHATSPFVDENDYVAALEAYRLAVIEGPHDSLMSVSRLQQFIWNDAIKTIVNCDRSVNPWPATQDLDPLFEVNSALFIASREIYLERHDRIGANPAMFETHGLKNVDIDWEEDFIIAQKLVGMLGTDAER